MMPDNIEPIPPTSQMLMVGCTKPASSENLGRAGIAKIPILALTIDAENGPRRRHCAALFGALGLSVTFVPGLLADEAARSGAYSSWRNLLLAKRALTPAEIAVYLGHRRIWHRIAEGAEEAALVVEDDLDITDRAAFLRVLAVASDHRDWEILKLFDFAPKRVVASHAWHGLTIVDYKYPASGCVAYLITRDAARRLLARRRIFRPVDEDLSWCWEFGLRVRSVLPNIVAETSHTLGGSLLEDGRLDLRRRKNRLRSLHGMLLALVKQIQARRHLVRLRRAG